MKSRYIKIIISVILIVSLSLAITITPASAISTPILIGGTALAVGGLAWALCSAMGVEFSLQNYTSQTVGDAFNPFYNIQQTLTTSDFTFIKGARAGLDALRLSLAAFNAIKAGSQDVIEENNIPDNTTGTIQYSGTVNGLPFYKGNDNYYYTDTFHNIESETDLGSYHITRSRYGSTVYYYYGVNGVHTGTSYVGPVSIWFRSQYQNNTQYWNIYVNGRNSTASQEKYTSNRTNIGGTVIDENVNLPYESGIVNVSFGSDALDNITIFFPTQSTLLPTSTVFDIAEAINNLALSGSEEVTAEIDYAPAPPIPTTPLGEVPYDEWIDTFGQSVYDKLDEQIDAIDNYGQSAIEALEGVEDTVDTVGQEVVDAVDAVDTNIQAGNGILSGIRSLIGSAVDTLENIGEMVGELVEDIVLGTETLISGILNQIPSLFNVILSPIKTAASIWHYVVEWIQSITGPFQFIWSMANGTSYYIVLPVYASLAAAVVLAFYKRFGK